jgi:hypothetical protein
MHTNNPDTTIYGTEVKYDGTAAPLLRRELSAGLNLSIEHIYMQSRDASCLE